MNGKYSDEIIMSILREEYRVKKKLLANIDKLPALIC